MVSQLVRSKYLTKLIDALEKVYGNNFPAAVTLLGAGVLALHYESINKQGNKVPAAIACGNVADQQKLKNTVPLKAFREL